MARIHGDDADLPEGWGIDPDNWGTRPMRAGDADALAAAPEPIFIQACHVDGHLFVMSAAVAAHIDRSNP